MNNILNIYEDATNDFMRCFDEYWNDMLNTLESHQAQLASGNKLRPQICLWGYLATVQPKEVSSHSLDFIANVAVSIEMVHKSSILLDDWLDEDIERRGRPTFHIEYDPQYTILFALNMIGYAMLRLGKAFPASIILPHHYYLCLDTLIKTINSMAMGALKEVQLQAGDFFNNEKIREITQLETAEIIGNSMLLGYYAGIGDKRDSQTEKLFKKVGDQCGYLFQALNDIEVFENPKQLAEHKGALNFDLFTKRKNIAVTTLYEIATSSDQLILQNADQIRLLSLMKKYRIVEYMKKELQTVYHDIQMTCRELHSAGLPTEWCKGFSCFLENVKKFAEERLKK